MRKNKAGLMAGPSGLMLSPLLSQPGAPSAAQEPLPGSVRNEKSDAYNVVVAVLNPRMRVIRVACGLQWIVQKRNSPLMWSNFAFCGTKEGLLLRLSECGFPCDPGAWSAIKTLPDYFPRAT